MSRIPDTWIATELGQLADSVQYGHTAKSSSENVGPRFLRITDIQDGSVDWSTVPYCSIQQDEIAKYRLNSNDLVFARTGATVGKSFLIKGKIPESIFASYLIRVRLSAALVPQYTYYFFQSGNYWRQVSDSSAGIGQPNVNGKKLAALQIPLAPLAEQKRIVAKIEELFSELEAGEASLRKARRQLGVYRQSLLKQAFEGKLTQKWRTQNPDKISSAAASDVSHEELKGFAELPRGWRYTRLGRSIRHIDAGKSFRCEERRPRTDEIGVAKVSAVTWGEYDEAESKTCIDPEKMNPDYFVRPGDFILSRANTIELVGACVIVRHVTQRIMLSDKTLRITMDDALKPFFLHYLRSRKGRLEIEKRSTGNQESMRNIGQERIRSIVVPECSLPEQQEIVRLLDAQFEAIERNEQELDAALQRSEALRQAILKKAFSGRLVPQDPADEPASTLLARLRSERAAAPTTKRKSALS